MLLSVQMNVVICANECCYLNFFKAIFSLKKDPITSLSIIKTGFITSIYQQGKKFDRRIP